MVNRYCQFGAGGGAVRAEPRDRQREIGTGRRRRVNGKRSARRTPCVAGTSIPRHPGSREIVVRRQGILRDPRDVGEQLREQRIGNLLDVAQPDDLAEVRIGRRVGPSVSSSNR